MLLVLTLIVGVLGMHALVLISTAPAAGEQMPTSVAMAAAAGPEGPDPVSVGVRDPAAMEGMTTAQPIGDDLEHAAPSGPDAGHGPMPSSMHHLLHLCLAILAALLAIGMAAFALWPAQRPDHQGISIGPLVRQAPRRRAPPTSERLAQLCVLRN